MEVHEKPSEYSSLSSLFRLWIPLLLILGIFLLDLYVPSNWAIWLLYFVPLRISTSGPEVRRPVLFATIATVLTVAGFLSDLQRQAAVPVGAAAFHRACGIGMIWVVALLPRQRKRREEELRKMAEAQLAHLASFPELNPTPVVETDLSGRVLYVNPAADRRFPGLREAGPAHPYLAGLETELSALRNRQACHTTRTRTIGDRHYHQTILLVEETQAARIYGADLTERVRAEEALKEQEALLRTVVETLPVGVFVLDKDGKIRIGNEMSQWIWGGIKYVGIEDYRSYKAWWPDTGEPVAPEEWSGVRALRRGEAVLDREIEIETFDGARKTILDSAVPIRDARGDIIGAVAIIQDITQKRKAAEALRESEEKHRRIVETASEGIWVTDADYRTTFVNRSTAEMFGYSMDEMLGRSGYDFFDEDGRECAEILLERWRKGIMERYEFRYRRKDDSGFWAMVSTAPLFDKTGRYAGVLRMLTDITRRRALEEELRRNTAELEDRVRERTQELDRYRRHLEELVANRTKALSEANAHLRRSEEQYRQIVETTTEGIWVLDASDRTVFANRVMAEMLGLADPEELQGKVPLDFVPEEDRSGCLELRKRVRNGEPITTDSRIRRPDGKILWGLISISPYMDEHGRYRGGLGMVTDITERKELEEQLRHAQRLESLGRLAGGVAHEFNNLMTVVNGYADILLSRISPDDIDRREIEQIRNAGARAAELTRQLLAFGRKQMMQAEVIDLGETVKRMSGMLARLVGEDIRIETHVSPVTGKVKADPGQIEQVVMNLAVNARDAMPRGGRLTIEVANVLLDESYRTRHEEFAPGPYVMIAVTDTGVGMDEATQARVFEPFFTTKEVGQGTGLGLSTVYGIVRQSGGHIWVYSEPGKGTTFKVFLPRVDAEVRTQRADEASSAETPRGRETILVAEDEEDLRGLVREILQSQGYTVLTARNAAEALRIGLESEGSIDLLLTDMVMPGMGGRELAEKVASRRPGTRVLFMSGYPRAAAVQEGDLEEGHAFLQKPFSAGILARKVRELLDAA